MYPVSDEYLTAIQDNTRSYYFEGCITTKAGIQYPFTNKDIVKGSGYITNQCSGNNEIEIGSVYAAELGITLYTDVDRYTLEGATVTISFFLQLATGNYEEVPLGIFEVSEANRTINCLAIKAYDYMLRFDKAFKNKVRNRMPMVHMKPLRLISGSIPVWKIRLQTILHICLEPRTVGHSVIKASKG